MLVTTEIEQALSGQRNDRKYSGSNDVYDERKCLAGRTID